jgi:hypothetical protein
VQIPIALSTSMVGGNRVTIPHARAAPRSDDLVELFPLRGMRLV